MRTLVLKLFTIAALTAASSAVASAQGPAAADPAEPQQAQAAPAPSRQALIEQEQADKQTNSKPYVANKGERLFERLDAVIAGGSLKWHGFFDSAYSGGGFTLGVGRTSYVSAYNSIDVRGSYTFTGYKRAEVEFVAPRMFNRRGHLSVLAGWREAPQVGFYGIGTNSSKDDRTNYLFQQPYASAFLNLFPTRRVLNLRGGVQLTQWAQKPGEGEFPSVETKYTPETLPGLGAKVTYLHTLGTIGFDSRTSPDYTRRGVFLGATIHDYHDNDNQFGFQMSEYEAIAHLPILRETWVLSLRGRVQSAFDKDGQQTPFFMLPSAGGGSSLRAFSSWRYRDKNSLLMQAEWRIMVSRYLDMAFFYDTAKVAARQSDLDFKDLKDNFGIGLRFHSPFATPLRIDLSRGRESNLSFTFSSSAAF